MIPAQVNFGRRYCRRTMGEDQSKFQPMRTPARDSRINSIPNLKATLPPPMVAFPIALLISSPAPPPKMSIVSPQVPFEYISGGVSLSKPLERPLSLSPNSRPNPKSRNTHHPPLSMHRIIHKLASHHSTARLPRCRLE